MYDVITIGGATLDIFLDIHEATESCRIMEDEKGEWFCLKRGQKIPVDGLHYEVGGNAANVAVGLSRLGVKTATHIHYGSDEISQKIVTTLKNEGVATEYVVEDQGETSPISIIINFAGDRTIFAHHIVRNHALPAISVPKWIYLTSVGERWEDLYHQVVEFAKANNVKLAFSPGSHQLDSGVDSFMDQVKTSYALFVNKEEGLKISNFPSGRASGQGQFPISNEEEKDMKTLLTQLKQIGPKIVSITDGSKGSFAVDENSTVYQLPAFPVTPLERTGAGDSYASGFLAALVHGLPASEAMRWGAVNAASVISSIGAEKGLLKKEEIENRLAENLDFQATPL